MTPEGRETVDDPERLDREEFRRIISVPREGDAHNAEKAYHALLAHDAALRAEVERLREALEDIQGLDDTPEPERVRGVFSREQARTISGLREYIYDMKRCARQALQGEDDG